MAGRVAAGMALEQEMKGHTVIHKPEAEGKQGMVGIFRNIKLAPTDRPSP